MSRVITDPAAQKLLLGAVALGVVMDGIDGSVVNERVKNSGKAGYGFDAYKEIYCDMVEAGIVDPTKVTRSALENASSIASILLTTEALVADKPKPENSPAHGAPDMGGMY